MLVGALYFVCLIPAHVDRAGPSAQSTKSVPLPFRDPTLPASTRAWDIIARLTVAEKAALLSNTAYTVERLGGTQFDGAVQSLQGNECLHGVGNVFSNASGRYFPDHRVTSFPQAPPPAPPPISPPVPSPTSPPAPPPTHYYYSHTERASRRRSASLPRGTPRCSGVWRTSPRPSRWRCATGTEGVTTRAACTTRTSPAGHPSSTSRATRGGAACRRPMERTLT